MCKTKQLVKPGQLLLYLPADTSSPPPSPPDGAVWAYEYVRRGGHYSILGDEVRQQGWETPSGGREWRYSQQKPSEASSGQPGPSGRQVGARG